MEKHNEENKTIETAAEYTYDANGYRISKTKASQVTRFVFDFSGSMIEEIKPDSEGTKYFGTNHLGSTTLLTDASGDILFDMETTPSEIRRTGKECFTQASSEMLMRNCITSMRGGMIRMWGGLSPGTRLKTD